MTQVVELDGPVTTARDAADRAATAAGCTVRDLDAIEELRAASGLFDEIWGKDGKGQLVGVEWLRALSHAGDYVAGAFVDGQLIGAAVGFFGRHGDDFLLHSHVTGLRPGRQHGGVGYALKLHQRAWALDRGVDTITWTFDPLVRRNAYFNLHKLGAIATQYHVDFYGAMDDAINGGHETDRLFVRWALRSPRVLAATEGHVPSHDVRRLAFNGAAITLEESDDGRPLTVAAEGHPVLCRAPDDIVSLRISDPEVAREWRLAQRATLGRAVADGYVVTGATRDGWYVLEPPAP